MKPIQLKKHIVFEDDDFIVINKPPFISSLFDRNAPISIQNEIKNYCQTATLAHRLDKNTSGCLIAAKHENAYKHIALQFEKRETKKVYHAIVDGQLNVEEELVDVPLLKTNKASSIVSGNGKPAATFFKTLQIFKNHTLMACQPVTGKFHQIRVHLQYIGYPIAADELYGGKVPYLSELVRKYKPGKRDENPMIGRFALHASSIKFKNMKNQEVRAEADYPKDFAVFLKLLQKNASI
ncbi:MAG: RluA family pseudouridine synthase [Bacteroidetes bacterium]|nr:RluA family pseudouridine synthase [Bacteroidota bacterium]